MSDLFSSSHKPLLTVEDKENLALAYEKHGLIVNALGVWMEIIEMDPSEDNHRHCQEFLTRNNLAPLKKAQK